MGACTAGEKILRRKQHGGLESFANSLTKLAKVENFANVLLTQVRLG